MSARQIHLHVDLDVHDPALAPANQFAPPDGLTPAEVQDSVRAIAGARPICSASFAAYDPAVDRSGACLEAGLQLIELVARVSGGLLVREHEAEGDLPDGSGAAVGGAA